MSLEAWLALAGMGITVALFVLTIVVAVIGYFLKIAMADVKEQLAELPKIRIELAVFAERQTGHGKELERHASWLGEHEEKLDVHAESIGRLALGGKPA